MPLEDGSTQTLCCSADQCSCDDICVENLARAICANDDDHIHPQGYDSASVTAIGNDEVVGKKSLAASDSCRCDGVGEKVDPDDEGASKATNAAAHTCDLPRQSEERCNGRAKLPKKACGGHRSIAQRQRETLASFGCICKAMIARGLQSCCSTKLNDAGHSIGLSAARAGKCKAAKSCASCCDDISSVKSRSDPSLCLPKSTSKDSVVSSCCGESCCGGEKEKKQSCCSDSHCGGSAAASRISLESCCGTPPPIGYSRRPTASGDAVLDLSADPSVLSHAAFAIKGMTCTGCENKLIRCLQALPSICNVKTSLVLARAEFDYRGTPEDLQVLIHTIEKRTGFSAEQIGLTSLSTLGIDVDPALLEKVLMTPTPDGLENVDRINKHTVIVTYDPLIIGARDVLEFYSEFSATLSPEPRDPMIAAGLRHIRSLLLRTLASALITIPVLVMTWAPLPSTHHRAYSITSLVLASIVQIGIAGPFYSAAFKSLFFSGIIETDLLIVLSTTIAFVYSMVAFAFDMVGKPLAQGEFFETSTLLVTLIMLGQLASAFARHRAIEAISLRSFQRTSAILVRADGSQEDIDGRLLHFGDIIKVIPDTSIITDGIVVEGQSEVDESMMTGESLPVPKQPDNVVVAGTANGPSTLLIKVTRLPGNNTITDIATLVDSARFSRAKVQATVDKVCGYFVPCILLVSLIVFAAWVGVGVNQRHDSAGKSIVTALTYAIAVLAISCPCAIGLAVPMVILIASGVAAKKMGLVFKSATTIEEARKVSHVVFDKTGTLTMGQLTVIKHQEFVVEGLPSSVDVGSAILTLLDSSKHPVARAAAAYLRATGSVSCQDVKDVEMVTGHGIRASLSGFPLLGGNPRWLSLQHNPDVLRTLGEGYTLFCVTYKAQLIAVFSLADTVRPEAQTVLSTLRSRGISISILSGDHAAAVHCVAEQLAVPASHVRAGCLPSDKQTYIKELTDQGQKVLFCGDGTNDAVALAQASIGVHMSSASEGGANSIAASSAADVVLLYPSLNGILSLLSLSRTVNQRILLNFAWSFVYNVVAVLFASGAFVHVRITPAYAGLGELVSVLPVVLGALSVKWVA
ncbi:hypothetical protein EUX98_g2447 [Antrodiella citrinella]|uniref:HMA domain-containing protein n=1 Tax=Antrodiella citrinella TaxID=2447956 RepID=A0A4S4MZ28_9APHY|nr:hypothetical protein EUX98_g2447 [Antrodiella citrinella]